MAGWIDPIPLCEGFILAMIDAFAPRSGLGGATRILDLDHLATPVLPAVGADVMGPLHFPAGAAWHEVDHGDEVVATAIALMGPADSLFGKCSHDVILLPRLCRALSHCEPVAVPLAACLDGNQSRPVSPNGASPSGSRSANRAKRSSGWPSGAVDRSRGPGQSGPQLGCIGIARRIHWRSASPRSI